MLVLSRPPRREKRAPLIGLVRLGGALIKGCLRRFGFN